MAEIVSRDEIRAVERLIRPWVRRTPVLRLDRSEFGLEPGPLVLKLEHVQHSGSFKARGAFSNMLQREPGSAGVVAASGGNHGAAVAYAARALGLPATIYVPTVSSPAKVDRIRSYGADLRITGATYSDAAAEMLIWAATADVLEIPAFDRLETMLGTGTLGLELEEQASDASTVIAAVGGGGLLAGVAAWYASSSPSPRVIGVEPRLAPTLSMALDAGQPVDAPAGGVAVDALAPRQIGALTFPVLRDHVDDVVLVEDDAILDAQRQLWDVARIVAEPSGSAALAAIISGAITLEPSETVAVVISGANTPAVSLT